jgi:chaperonin GroEL
MAKQLLFNVEGRNKIKKGVDRVADAVKVTLGPKGRNVLIERKYSAPHITKDGVTVARTIELSDHIENMGAQMVKNVAAQTVDDAGDGTTTATVLTQIMVSEGLKNVAAGANPMDLKKGIDKATDKAVMAIKASAIQFDDDLSMITDIAKVSANGDEIVGGLIGDAMGRVGRNGIIQVEESKIPETRIEIVPGMRVDRGYKSNYFINTPRGIVEHAKPYILVTDKKISRLDPIMPLIELVMNARAPLIIIADDVDGEALHNLILNNAKGILASCIVSAPSFGDNRKEIMKDICVRTGAQFISEDLGRKLENVTLDMLGKCDTIKVYNDRTEIIRGYGERGVIDVRIAEIQQSLNDASISDIAKEKLLQRRATLDESVAILYVGASTEIEYKEKMDRIDDAIHATRAAIEEGIVPGGGIVYIKAQQAIQKELLDSEKDGNADILTGMKILLRSLEEPLRQIVANTGNDSGVVINEVKKSNNNFGYDARSEKYCDDMIKSGIIDPAKVSRVALENAASVAGLILTTECVIADEPEEKKEASASMPHMMQ